MAKSFHKKSDGSVVVKDNGKIVTNLPSGRNVATMTPKVPLKNVARMAEFENNYDDYYAAFRNGKVAENVADIDADIAHLDANIYAIQKEASENPDATFVVGELPGITVETYHKPEDVVSAKEAADLYRLEKALLREKRTEILVAQDKAEGFERITEFGEGPLGEAIVEGFHEPNTKEWLLARTQGIGGSDKIGYVDENGKFVSYDSVDKKGYLNSVLEKKSPAHIAEIENGPDVAVDPVEQALPLRIGNALERTIQYEFAVNHTEYVHLEDKTTRVASGGRTWHRFNPDGVLQERSTGEYGIFEAKTSRDKATFEKALPGYRAQCLHNAAAAGLKFAVLVADVEGSKKQYVERIEYTDQELQDYRDAVDRVWLLYKPTYDRKRR